MVRICLFVALAFVGYWLSLNGPSMARISWGNWSLFVAAPFFVLACVSLVKRVPLAAVVGACVAGVLAIAIPYGLFLHASNQSGSGVPIGGVLLVLPMPMYLPIAMALGAFVGSRFKERAAPNSGKE